MPRYHVIKAKDAYAGRGYQGPSGVACGYVGPLEFDELQDARRATVQLGSYNPVGWQVIDSHTNEAVHFEP